jgi:hypothetical protein
VSLTGWPLLVTSVLASMGAIAGTIWCWGRGGWWRTVIRTAGVLVCEALLLFTAGLIVNRSLGDLFPSWSALLDQDKKAPPPTVVADPATKLDTWLHSKAIEGTHNGLVFEWHPSGAAAWHLPAPPVIYVPPRYFTAKTARFPVVLVLAPAKAGPAQGAWDPHKINLIVPRADGADTPAVIVFLRTDHPDAAVLTRTLPRVLDGDLRTTSRAWGLVGVDADAAAGLDALVQDPLRFWSAAAVIEEAAVPKAVSHQRALLDWQSELIVGKGHPADTKLSDALHWVYTRLPAPLTPPLTGPVDPNAPR